MLRARFTKEGMAVYISHLDLMRLLQRAFQRAGLPLTHSQGYNPRPIVSIALPMSLGMESGCELLDFQLEGETPPMEEIRDRLNCALIPGVHILQVYPDGRKLKELATLRCCLTLEYDGGIPCGAEAAIPGLLDRESVVVTKKSKSGPVEQDILPMIRSMAVRRRSDHELELEAVVCCQNPTLNPMLLEAAIRDYLPEYVPDFTRCRRLELYDREGNVFR